VSPARSIPISAAARPLAVRMRPDLVVVAQSYGAVRYWLVKDPVGLRYFHLGEEEYGILKMLDGRSSLCDLERRFASDFAPLQVTSEQLHGFVGHLYELGLLLAEAPGQGDELLRRRSDRRRRAWVEALTNLLSIRFRGVDPEPLLGWLYPGAAWMFSTPMLALCLGLVLSAITMAAVQFDIFMQRLGESTAFWTAGNLVWLAVGLAIAKGFHELGHALTCRHFGGECHEIGLLLLVGTPCFYCDVSDAWLLPNKWHRIAISVTGIVVEIVMASVCFFLWWFSEPGLLNTLFLNIVVVCSVNTVVVNGNPLLRYDGYYALADWLEIPNLSQQGRAVASDGFSRFFFGAPASPDRYVPDRLRTVVGLYGIASLAYRWCVVLVVLWMLYRFLKPHGLQVIAELFAVAVVAGMAAVPLARLGGKVFRPGAGQSFLARRAVVCSLVLLLAAVGCLLTPLPFRVSATVVLHPKNARYVYVTVSGRLAETVPPGTRVAEDQELVRLANAEIGRDIAELSGQREQQRLRLESLRLRLLADPSIASQIPPAEEALADVDGRWRQRRHDQENLVLRAPVAGTIYPPPWTPRPPFRRGGLASWHGTPLDARNIGAFLTSGTLACIVGDPLQLEAVAVVDQGDLEFVRTGQSVRLKLDALPGRVLEGTVVEVAKTDLKLEPRELAAQSDQSARGERTGRLRPTTTSYQVRIAMSDWPPGLLVGARGRAKILAAPQTLGNRLLRGLSQVFRFAL